MLRDNTSLTLGLDLGGKIPLERFIQAVQDFLDILRDVDSQTTQRAGGSLNWVIDDLSGGSAHVNVVPEPRDELTPLWAASTVVDHFSRGIAILATEGVTPPFFTDRSVRKAHALTSLVSEAGITQVGFRMRGQEVTLTRAMVDRAVRQLEGQLKAIGTVEGTLETVSVHGAAFFNVYRAVTGEPVRCTFPRELLDRVKAALSRRVLVRGTIHTRPNGNITSVRVRELEVFPDESELPTVATMRGILNHG